MFARTARWILLLEFAAYGLAALLAHALGLGWPAALALIPVLALVSRCAFVGSTFLVASALSTAGERAHRSGRRRLRLVAAEILWTTLTFSVLMPFPRLAGRADSRVSGGLPVLLVHGYICNRGIWARMRRFLEANGVPTYAHDLEPVYAGIDDYVPALATRIEEVCAKTGVRQLAIVAHSMGGLAARAYLRAYGSARVAKLITLGTPHHGTRTAAFGLGENARQMRPGSAWLESLSRAESAAAATVPITSIYTGDDNVVVPAESSVLAQGCNVALSGMGHVSLPYSAQVHELVLDNVQAIGARKPLDVSV